ncbi:MAG: sugar transferase [Veillonellales bacterium]
MNLKRVFDFVSSVCLLAAFSPVMLVAALLIKLNMGSPIFFKQIRAGLYGSHFYIYKFRTMIDAKDEYGEFLPDAVRVTRLGRFLRNFSLDELPQLYNVSRGDMSLVGPRPLLLKYLPYYSARESLRHTVRPGITGLAQISGRNLLSWDEKLELDAKYVENWSLWLDLKILFLTFLRVVNRSGVVSVQDSMMLALDKERELKIN